MSYRKKRYLTYALITIITFVTPFITIDGNHLLLLSFEKLQFHFLGLAFSVTELYVMPFLLIILFVSIFAITAILGRFWCGWACPQTIFMEMVFRRIEYVIEGDWTKQKKLNKAPWKGTKIFKKVLNALFVNSIIWAKSYKTCAH